METFLIGAASNTLSTFVTAVIPPLMLFIDDVINFDQNTQLLQDKLTDLKVLLQDLTNQFQHDQRSPPETVARWLQKLQHSLREARSLIDRSQQQKQCLDCLFRKRTLSTQIREWRTNFDELLSELERAFSLLHNVQQISLLTPLPQETLLQPVPELGFVGLRIQEAKTMVQTWLNMEDLQFRVIGIYGLGGIGKTSLLKNVYNNCKKGNLFPSVIWITVSQSINLLSMQSDIAEAIKLDLGSSSNAETRKMKLFTSLKERKFLLVLDDVWSPLDLEEEVGIPVGNEKGSRVIISTRSIDVIRRMRANDYSIQIKPLSEEEGWELFCRKAFKDGSVPTKSIEEVARRVAGECKGLPLAINVVAAAVMGNTTVDEWNLCLSRMKKVDPVFLSYSGIDKGLFQRLKWSYDSLPDSDFRNCFLYSGAFPEDKEIDVERLVEMWIGEGLVDSRETNYLMEVGREYVKLLVERCLFESASQNMSRIKVHDIVRDMAIYVAEKAENCLFRTSQNLQNFPAANEIFNSKRISMCYNDIPFLPTDLTCPNLLALLLGHNKGLTAVPNGFFVNVTTLRVLDMSYTNIESLPVSIGHLTQLEFLDLSGTSIKNLPEDICNFVRLQFLHLGNCRALESLPSQIGELKSLKHLDLNDCGPCLTDIPRGMSQLASLYKLSLWTKGIALKTEEAGSGVCSLKDLTNIPNLMELYERVKAGMEVDGTRSGIKLGIMGSWLEMRDLMLEFDVEDGPDDDVVTEDLPQDMQNMEKLQSFHLAGYCGRRLPNCICDFKQLESLTLLLCHQLSELPLLERLPNLKSLQIVWCKKLRELGIGRWGSEAGFPMLEELRLDELPELESMRSSSSNIVWSEGLMPNLQWLTIRECPSLKRVPKETAKLPKLKEICAHKDWWEKLIWEDDNVPNLLKDKLTWIY